MKSGLYGKGHCDGSTLLCMKAAASAISHSHETDKIPMQGSASCGRLDADSMIRASSSSAPTARSSASRTASPNRSSFSARTRVALPGPCYAVGKGERVSLRYAPLRSHHCMLVLESSMLMHFAGASQDPPSPPSEVPACRRRCISRRNQGASLPASRGSRRGSLASDQGGQGEACCGTEREEGGQGQGRREGRVGPGWWTVSLTFQIVTYASSILTLPIGLLASRQPRVLRRRSRLLPAKLACA